MHRISKAHRAQSIAQYAAVRKKKLCGALCILKVGHLLYKNGF
jgi:hypothetical protein